MRGFAENPFVVFYVVVLTAAVRLKPAFAVGKDVVITTHQLKDNEMEVLTLNSSQIIQFELQQLTNPSSSYVVFQVHTQWQQLKVSLDGDFSALQTKEGTSVGLLTLLQLGQNTATWFAKLSSEKEDDEISVNILVVATSHNMTDPIPGGCNMEFTLEVDPNLKLLAKPYLSTLSFQYAHIGAWRGGFLDQCETKGVPDHLEYDVYQIFLNERELSETHFFKKLKEVLDTNAASFHKENTKVKTIKYGKSKTEVDFASYPAQGVIYVIIAKQTFNVSETYAAYVPLATYSCSWTQGRCVADGLDSVTVKFLAILQGLLGLFWCFFGHRFFKFSMFLVGHLAFLLAFFMVFAASTNMAVTGLVLTSCGFGLLGGALWLSVWVFAGVPVISVLLAGILLGLLFASLVFNYTPFGLLYLWGSSFNFGMTFACGVLIPVVLLLAFTKLLSIVSSAFIGAYLVVFALDVFLRGSVRLIAINTILKAAIPGFLTQAGPVPLQTSDIVLCVTWGLVAVSGCAVQWWRERDRPDFPPCPWLVFKKYHERHRGSLAPISSGEDEPLLSDSTDYRPDIPRLEPSVQPVVDPI